MHPAILVCIHRVEYIVAAGRRGNVNDEHQNPEHDGLFCTHRCVCAAGYPVYFVFSLLASGLFAVYLLVAWTLHDDNVFPKYP